MKNKILLFSAVLMLTISVFAQEKELNVLFVGNSYTYNNNLPHIVALLSEGTSTKLNTRRSVIGGAFISEHWNGKRGLETKKIIEEGNFDLVVLQDNSMAALNLPDSLLKYVKKFAEFNREHGAKTLLFNTWAREKVPQWQAKIDLKYQEAADLSGATRIPVGNAWQVAKDIQPTIDLYIADGSHPTILGTLLTASIFVKAITGELPDKYPRAYKTIDQYGETVELMHMNELDSEFCRLIAEKVYGELR
jgi:hypothetical protein